MNITTSSIHATQHSKVRQKPSVERGYACTLCGKRNKSILVHFHNQGDRHAHRQSTVQCLATSQTLIAEKAVASQQVIMEVNGNECFTRVDADAHPLVGSLAAERGEVIALALWVMAEQDNPNSKAAALLSSLPSDLLTPILWAPEELSQLLRGSPVAAEARERAAAIQQEWQLLQDLGVGSSLPGFDAGVYNLDNFKRAVCTVLAASVYLPSAECLALIPGVSPLRRSGSSSACTVDYNLDTGAVQLVAQQPVRAGQQLLLYDERPNGELLLACGQVDSNNPNDFLTLEVGLLAADRMYNMKKQVVEELGFSDKQVFPIYADRMPVQLLAYLRLSRIADSAQFAKVTFERDLPINDMNEYEILQLLMGDCRERMQQYEEAGDMEVEVKRLQDPELSPKERVATQLRLEEKRILRGTMDAARRKLAPIRGIPTKSGQMADPNADLMEIFQTIEDLPQAPKKLVDGFLSWARGDKDPNWKR